VKLELPAGLTRLLASLRDAGGRPYVVGGAVRDALLRLPLEDWDVEVFGLSAERLEALLAGFGKVEFVKPSHVAVSGSNGSYTYSVNGGKTMKASMKMVAGGDGHLPPADCNRSARFR